MVLCNSRGDHQFLCLTGDEDNWHQVTFGELLEEDSELSNLPELNPMQGARRAITETPNSWKRFDINVPENEQGLIPPPDLSLQFTW